MDDGNLPDVLCLVAYVLDANLQHVWTVRLWRGEFGSTPPFDIGPRYPVRRVQRLGRDDLLHGSGWQFPEHIFDLHTAYLAASNYCCPTHPTRQRKKPRKRLSDACRAYGIEGWENIDKDSIAEEIGAGHWHEYGREAVFTLLRGRRSHVGAAVAPDASRPPRFPAADVPRVLCTGRTTARSALHAFKPAEFRSTPRCGIWCRRTNAAVIGELLRRFDPSYGSDDPIYTPEGEWSYARFERWLSVAGITGWPRLDSGALNIYSDAFRLMYHLPGIEDLHALRDSVGFIAKARLPIGRDGRNRPSLFPFGTATGRNAHARSPYNAHAGVAVFIDFPPDTIGAYFDWRTQEVGVAAAVWRSSADGGLPRRRCLSRARAALRLHRRPRPASIGRPTTPTCASA